LGFRSSNALLGVYNFSGSTQDYKKRLVDWALQAQQGVGTSVLMCHPAVKLQVDGSEISDPIYPARLNEFSVLNSESFNAIFNEVKIVREP